MSRVQLTLARLVEVAAAALVGAGSAVAIAVALSPLTPLGVARLAEPSPGGEVNVAVLGLGAAATVLLLLARWYGPRGVWRGLAPSPARQRRRHFHRRLPP